MESELAQLRDASAGHRKRSTEMIHNLLKDLSDMGHLVGADIKVMLYMGHLVGADIKVMLFMGHLVGTNMKVLLYMGHMA